MRQRQWRLCIAAAAIVIAIISIFLLQNKKEIETVPEALPTPVATNEPADASEPALEPMQEPPPDLTFSPAAAAALPQDELTYTLADPTPAPTPELLTDDTYVERSVRRNDNPDLTAWLEDLSRQVNAMLPGRWVGSAADGDMWHLSFSADGIYSLTVGGVKEQGTFELEHRVETYHTLLHLAPDGNKAPYDYQICLAEIDGQICLEIKGSEYPTFYREE